MATYAQSTPYTGTPVTVPATIEAENFDRGGEGVAYHDTTAVNTGGQYRTSESVDIITSCDSAGGGYVVNNFQTGEWMKYTVNVPVTGNYDIDVRGSSNYGNGVAFHVEVDNVNVTGSVPFASTGSWCAFAWSPKKTVSLTAGTHVLKLYADSQYMNVNSLRVVANTSTPPPSTSSTPFTGTPIVVPGTIEAENFDKGGQNVAYYDTTPGNQGGQYRTAEDVDIIVSSDSAGGGYLVNNFVTGEWMKYTINVPVAGNYDLAVRASTNFTTSAFHIEVDGVNVTGRVTVPYTDSWTTFVWVPGATGVPLSAGTHVLKLVSDQQYFNVNSLRVLTSTTGSTTGGTAISSAAAWSCDFENTYCQFLEQSALGDAPPSARRSSLVSTSRSGGLAVRLHTEPGDNNVHGSGTWERDDLSMGPDSSYCNQGQDEWWAHSVMFPSDYVFPPGPEAGIIFDFHHNYSSGQSNFEIQTIPGVGLRMEGYGGATIDGGRYDFVIADPYSAPAGSVARNVWYDFVYHAKWSSGSDGRMEAWLNGKKVMTYNGPTLYSGISCYLKLANYHAPFGQPSSVIHDRIVRGPTAASVAITPLEGVP